MVYAIIEASGKQLFVSPGKFYDINRIPGEPGDIVDLKRILLINSNGLIELGEPCLKKCKVKAIILKHLKGRKISVFKMKPKKNTRSKFGHRQNLTRLLIQEIVN